MQILDQNRYSVLSELSAEERRNWFYLKAHSVVPHIDSLYYSVSIAGDENESQHIGLRRLLEELAKLKQQKLANMMSAVTFCDLEVMATGFSIYEYRLSLNETFDIFIGKYLPNPSTPRIVVQLRSRSLVLDTVSGSILKSFEYVKLILSTFGLEVGEVRENRIDYAYHTNLIQNPYRFFADDRLLRNLKTKMGIGQKVFRLGKDIRLDYFALGQKKSNAVFFRCYNKSQEVIEKNYKPFFLERWLEHHLISEYDAYCYRTAYAMRSYRTGLLIGRMRWYIEHGKDPVLKEKFEQAIRTAYENSDNAEYLEEQLAGVLPPVTLIMNVEFQTKRRFYASFQETHLKAVQYTYSGEPVLTHLMKILSVQPDILKYLTSESICFVVDRNDKRNDRMCDWWKRIHDCRIPYTDPVMLELYRRYDRKTDLGRSRSRLQSAIAQYIIVARQSLDLRSFAEDANDVLCALNDNDFYGFATDEYGNPAVIASNGYDSIRNRKARQYKGIIKQEEEQEQAAEAMAGQLPEDDELPY